MNWSKFGLAAGLPALATVFACATEGDVPEPEPTPPASVLCEEEPTIPLNVNSRHVLGFAAADDSVDVRITRQRDGQGVGESTIYRMVRFSLRGDGHDVCNTDETTMDYVNTHHNWADDALLTLDDVTYELQMRFTFEGNDRVWTDTLTGTNNGSDVVFGPLVLIEEAGETIR